MHEWTCRRKAGWSVERETPRGRHFSTNHTPHTQRNRKPPRTLTEEEQLSKCTLSKANTETNQQPIPLRQTKGTLPNQNETIPIARSQDITV